MVEPYHQDERVTLYHGDCLQVLADLPADSVDAVVTDPPYGLAFMGKRWDYDVPSVEIWQQVLRVLKPGGHLLAFAGTRTQHRMAVRIEDAGFEIRDLIMWVYGSGFPKSLDVSKAIDKRGGNVAAFTEFRDAVKAAMQRNGMSRQQLQDALGNFMLSHYLTAGSQPAVPVLRDYRIIRDTVGLGHQFDELFNDEAEREVVGQRVGVDTTKQRIACATSAQGLDKSVSHTFDITAPATEAAKQWAGWGTALKPAVEPVTMARKPLAGTVAENVLQYGTGGINVDGCRVGTEVVGWSGGAAGGNTWDATNCGLSKPGEARPVTGRWPANVIHDGSEEVVRLFPETDADGGSAARFFYTAKADASERRGSKHPTVKPLDLMRYLVRLVCPVGGVVLDPFSGSGTTIEAARDEHCRSIGIEMNAEYLADTLERLKQGVLF